MIWGWTRFAYIWSKGLIYICMWNHQISCGYSSFTSPAQLKKAIRFRTRYVPSYRRILHTYMGMDTFAGLLDAVYLTMTLTTAFGWLITYLR